LLRGAGDDEPAVDACPLSDGVGFWTSSADP
jgi:hypothetical protein